MVSKAKGYRSSEPHRDIHFLHGQLPRAPSGAKLKSISFRTCPSKLELTLLHDAGVDDSSVDEYGVPGRLWLDVSTPGLPSRVMRLTTGTDGLRHLIEKYGFLDSEGCMHHREGVCRYMKQAEGRAGAPDFVPSEHRSLAGVPQFYPRSGVCWYASLCVNAFLNPKVRSLFQNALPAKYRPLCERCLYSRDDAEALRKALWFDYGVGDDVTKPPQEDGCNGFLELSLLCAKVCVPMLRFSFDGKKLQEMKPTVSKGRTTARCGKVDARRPHLLGLRYPDWTTAKAIPRRLEKNGVRYRLVGVFMGSRACGHQIGLGVPTGDWRSIVLTDADLHKRGVGPTFVHFSGAQWVADFPKALSALIHITKYGMGGTKACSLSPLNVDNSVYLPFAPDSEEGRATAVDMVYLSDHCEQPSDAAPRRGR